jgi:hypothetical protein
MTVDKRPSSQPEGTQQPSDQQWERDQLWTVSFGTYYHAHYQELLASRIIDRWQKVDEITKVVVALTATGSAVAGWALWNEPTFKTIWLILAGIASVLSIIHTTLDIPGRLKEHGEIKRRSASLRVDLETFRQQMQIDWNFPVKEFKEKYEEYRRRYSSEVVQLLRNDVIITQRLARRVQADLNTLIKDQIS